MIKLKILAFAVFSVFVVSFSYADEEIRAQFLPVDSDSDGVIDDVDECHETIVGMSVDERGCYINVRDRKKITLNVNFDVDSSEVKREFFPEVEQVANFMKQHSLTRVVIEGHTDSDGPSQYNTVLSQRRAQAVAWILVMHYGIPSVRVTAVGFGENRPLINDSVVQNKPKNRRVVAVIRSVNELRG